MLCLGRGQNLYGAGQQDFFGSKKVFASLFEATKKSLRPVVLMLQKSLCPVVLMLKKSLRPVVLVLQKSLHPVVLMLQKSLRPVVSVFCTKIHENLKIGDIGSTFSVRKLENDMKPVVHHKDRILSCFYKSNYFFQKWSLSNKTGEIKKGPNLVRYNIKLANFDVNL